MEGRGDPKLVDKLAATKLDARALSRSCSRQQAREANPVGVLIVSEDLTTLSSLESLLEHASPYKCRAFVAPSHQVALEMLDDLPLRIHMVLCELAGDHTYEFAAHLDQTDKYPALCGIGLLSSGAMKVRTPAPTESFLALRIPKTQEQVNKMVELLLNNTSDTTSLHSSPSGVSQQVLATKSELVSPPQEEEHDGPMMRRDSVVDQSRSSGEVSDLMFEDIDFTKDSPYIVLMRTLDVLIQGNMPPVKHLSSLHMWLSTPDQLHLPLALLPNRTSLSDGHRAGGISDQVRAMSRTRRSLAPRQDPARSVSNFSSCETNSANNDRVPRVSRSDEMGRFSGWVERSHSTVERSLSGGTQAAQHAAFVNPNNAAVIATLLRVDPHLENLAGWSQIRATLVRLPYWDMDVFKLKADLGQHCVVAVVGLSLMCKLGLLETLPLDEQEIYSYLKWVGKSMFDNPYHNSCHVADVMHSVGLILYSRSTKDVSASAVCLMERMDLTDEELLAILFAAAIHDLQHPGVTNDYLVQHCSSLALRYNDRAVAESNSASVAFRKMLQPGYGVFNRFMDEDRKRLRSSILRLVESTDMQKHLRVVAKLGALELKLSHCENTEYLAAQLDAPDRDLLMRCVLKMADLGHLVHKTHMHTNFVTRLMEEFFSEGDLLEEEGRRVMPMFRRTDSSVTLAQSQCSFFDFVALPFFRAFAKVFPSDWLERATVNYQYWRSKLDGEQEERTVRLKPAASTAASTFLSQLPEEGGA